MQIKKLRLGGEEAEHYVISDKGDIWNTRNGYMLQPQRTGYKHVRIGMPSGYKNVRIHRAVAETFIHDIGEDEVVNHLDGNKLNNNLINLEIVSQSNNVKHSLESRRKAKADRMSRREYVKMLNQVENQIELIKAYEARTGKKESKFGDC